MSLPTHLGNILDESDSKFDVGEDVEEVQPSQLVSDRHEEGDDDGEPHGGHQDHPNIGHTLAPTLKRKEK